MTYKSSDIKHCSILSCFKKCDNNLCLLRAFLYEYDIIHVNISDKNTFLHNKHACMKSEHMEIQKYELQIFLTLHIQPAHPCNLTRLYTVG